MDVFDSRVGNINSFANFFFNSELSENVDYALLTSRRVINLE